MLGLFYFIVFLLIVFWESDVSKNRSVGSEEQRKKVLNLELKYLGLSFGFVDDWEGLVV